MHPPVRSHNKFAWPHVWVANKISEHVSNAVADSAAHQ